MRKETLSLTLLSLLLIAGIVPIAWEHNAPFPPDYDYSHLVLDVTGLPQSFDPAFHYDTTSASVIMNVYETLIFFNRVYTEGPYLTGKTDQFVPQLASALPTIFYFDPPLTNPKGGLPIYTQYIFEVRTGVPFHCGGTLTPRDIEYSIERGMVQDRAGGPTWLFWEPLLGLYAHEEPSVDPNFGLKIDGTTEQNGTHVWFNVGTIYPDLVFKQILCQTWSSVMSEAWAVGEGDLNMAEVSGGWANWQYIHDKWTDPEHSFIEDAIDNPDPNLRDGGTGPYKMNYKNASAWSIKKFDTYWGGWPAPVPGSTIRLPGYLTTITWNLFVTWSTRLSRFLAGDSDMTCVPRLYRDQVLGQIVGGEKIRCYYPLYLLALDAFFFTFDVAPTSAHCGSNPGSFNPNGIQYNMFSDINVRKAFSHAINFTKWIQNAYLGEGEQPSDPIVKGLAYDNPDQPKPEFNMALVEYYLKLAWGGTDNAPAGPPWGPEDVPGALWNGGMGFELVWPAGAVVYQLACQQLEININGLQPDLFKITDRDYDWGTYILPHMVDHDLPLFMSSWTADFTDPHDFVHPFMHSQGTFAYSQVYSNIFVDDLIEQGIVTPDLPWSDTKINPTITDWQDRNNNGLVDVGDWVKVEGKWYEIQLLDPMTVEYDRRMIYYELQELYYEEVPSVPLVQPFGRHWEQAWVRGWYYNPLYGGSGAAGIDSTAPQAPAFYAYHLWKAKTHFGDINNDGAVNLPDLAELSSHWTGPPAGVAGFNPRADLTGGTGGTTGSEWGLVDGIADGEIDILDWTFLSGYWDVPLGPSHPTSLEATLQPSLQPPLQQTIPIGDTIQANPFESNPTASEYANIYPTPTAITLGYIRDGDFATNLNWRIGYYPSTTTGFVEAKTFENTPPTTFTIGWVDLKINYKASATTDDTYRIVYQVAPSTEWLVLQDWISGAAAKFNYDGAQDERAWSNVAEPNDGVWDWTDIGNVKVRVETQRQGAVEDSTLNRFYLYEVWLTIYEGTYPPPGNVSIQPSVVTGLGTGEIFFIDVFATNVVNMHGFQFFITYNTTVLTAIEHFTYSPFILNPPSEINNAIGYVSVAFSSHMGDSAGFTGSGPIIRIYFSVNADGRSLLHFKKSKLATTRGKPIAHTVSDGVFATTLPDVAITSITPSKTVVGQGYSMFINVVVENNGLYTETFDVTAYYDSNVIGTQTVTTLPPGNSITLTFAWDTTGVAKGSYTTSAYANPVLCEIDTADNTLTNGIVKVVTPGDVNADGVVNILDLSSISAHWSGPPTGPLGYDPNFDINCDGAINILEISIISAYWTGPPKGPLDP